MDDGRFKPESGAGSFAAGSSAAGSSSGGSGSSPGDRYLLEGEGTPDPLVAALEDRLAGSRAAAHAAARSPFDRATSSGASRRFALSTLLVAAAAALVLALVYGLGSSEGDAKPVPDVAAERDMTAPNGAIDRAAVDAQGASGASDAGATAETESALDPAAVADGGEAESGEAEVTDPEASEGATPGVLATPGAAVTPSAAGAPVSRD